MTKYRLGGFDIWCVEENPNLVSIKHQLDKWRAINSVGVKLKSGTLEGIKIAIRKYKETQ